MSMICSKCNQTGIRWMGPLCALTHTECPHCGGTNCQVVEPGDCCECEERCSGECSKDLPEQAA